MSHTSIDATDVAILGRVLQPDKPTLSPDAARSLLALEIGQADRELMHQLALKAQEGSLTAEEEAELESYQRVGSLLAMMKSKARKTLKKDHNESMATAPSAPVLDRLLDAVSRCLTPDAARALVDLRADSETQKRINELVDKCNEGLLSPEERSEYAAYVSFTNFIAILQAKARKLFAHKRTGA